MAAVGEDALPERSRNFGLDAYGKDWYWGHMDSEVEPPEKCPGWLNTATMPLKLMSHADYFRDFARFAACKTFLDDRGKNERQSDGGCPFLGGTAYMRHRDVKSRLERVVPEHVKGEVTRKNELGYFELQDNVFPETGGLTLGGSVEEHRLQRKWVEFMLSPERLPDRNGWLKEIKTFLGSRQKVKMKADVERWWQQMLWKHVLKKDVTEEFAGEFNTFQEQWLMGGVLAFGS
jgi:hypothetical protein